MAFLSVSARTRWHPHQGRAQISCPLCAVPDSHAFFNRILYLEHPSIVVLLGANATSSLFELFLDMGSMLYWFCSRLFTMAHWFLFPVYHLQIWEIFAGKVALFFMDVLLWYRVSPVDLWVVGLYYFLSLPIPDAANHHRYAGGAVA